MTNRTSGSYAPRKQVLDDLVITADEFSHGVHPDLKRVPVNGQGAEYLKKALAFYAKKKNMTLTEARDQALKNFIPTKFLRPFFDAALDTSGYELTDADYYPGKYDEDDEAQDDHIDE